MKFTSVPGNHQKLDGGAMFGNAPRPLWEKWSPPDEHNRIPLATRCLLVETSHHTLLFEAGIGAFMDPQMRKRFGVDEKNHVLIASLKEKDILPEAITEIVLSHLHFDHAGGLLSAFQEGEAPHLIFPNATVHVSQTAWDRAISPHSRDRASFIPALNSLLKESGRLKTLEKGDTLQFDDVEIHFFHSDGHTPGMICSDLRWKGGRMVFAGDLVPGVPWIHLPITMGYDRYPEKLIEEKQRVLESVAADDALLFFTHDKDVAAARIRYDDQKKKFIPGDTIRSLEMIWP